jgi:indole-3-glycerol phosphate synthase
METVIEVHSTEEMKTVLKLNPRIMGINNRDILRLETDSGDVSRTESMARLAPDHVLLISESSIKTRRDVERAIDANVDAVLIGTALMKATSLREKLEELIML